MEVIPTKYNVNFLCAKAAQESSAGAQITGPMLRSSTNTDSKSGQLSKAAALHSCASMISRFTRAMILEREIYLELLTDVS